VVSVPRKSPASALRHGRAPQRARPVPARRLLSREAGSATSSITASAPATPPDDHALRICRTAAYERVGPSASFRTRSSAMVSTLLIGRDEARHTKLTCRLASHRNRQHRVERRARAADPLRHALHTARDGHGPHGHLNLTENRVPCRHDEIARQRQLDASAEPRCRERAATVGTGSASSARKAPVVLRGEEAELGRGQAAEHCRVAATAEVRTFGAQENRAEVVRRRTEDRLAQLLVELHV